MKVDSIHKLIKGCFKKQPEVLAKNTKDSHMNTIGSNLVLLSSAKNAHVFNIDDKQIVAELHLKNREMSCSLVYKHVLLVGTYVDTLFVFRISDFQLLHSMRTHDSILTICTISEAHNFIALGQAGGQIDIVKL